MKKLTPADRGRVQAVIDRNRRQLSGIRGYLDALPGVAISNGKLIRKPAIIALVKQKLPVESLAAGETAPASLDGIRVDVQTADLDSQLALLDPASALGLEAEGAGGQETELCAIARQSDRCRRYRKRALPVPCRSRCRLDAAARFHRGDPARPCRLHIRLQCRLHRGGHDRRPSKKVSASGSRSTTT